LALVVTLTPVGSLSAQSFGLPQIVAGKFDKDTLSTTVTVSNDAQVGCGFLMQYFLGPGEDPTTTLLTNGASEGNSFLDSVPPGGTRTFEITVPGSEAPYLGGAAVSPFSVGCRRTLQVDVAYRVRGEGGDLSEVFSYPSQESVPFGQCAEVPIDYVPGLQEPGVAMIAVAIPEGAATEMALLDSDGNPAFHRNPEPWDGHHNAKLLTEFFNLQGPFEGKWRVCFNQAPEVPGSHTADEASALFIDVSTQGHPQLSTRTSQVVNPECQDTGDSLCLNNNRFRVSVDWSNGSGSQTATPDRIDDDAGYFWFEQPGNFDMVVQVLNSCDVNDHYWVFAAATTNVDYTLRVTDTLSGQSRQFTNPAGPAGSPVLDTEAFATCP
jgi:hypothetical protein